MGLTLWPKKIEVRAKSQQTIVKETKKLLKTNFIWEIQLTTLLANVVMVKKALGKWRICMDFTSLNKTCSKDSFLLRSINKLVNNMFKYLYLSFMDAYSRYNQIRLNLKMRTK